MYVFRVLDFQRSKMHPTPHQQQQQKQPQQVKVFIIVWMIKWARCLQKYEDIWPKISFSTHLVVWGKQTEWVGKLIERLFLYFAYHAIVSISARRTSPIVSVQSARIPVLQQL